jgi:biopolymer transport protein ExbD
MRRRKEAEADFELNIASIIDCFTVLITYLLLSASFISLGIIDLTVTSNSPLNSGSPSSEPKLSVTVGIQKNSDLKISTEGIDQKTITIAGRAGVQDFESLAGYIAKLKELDPTLDAATVVAEDQIEYKTVVTTIETLHKSLGQIALSPDLSDESNE